MSTDQGGAVLGACQNAASGRQRGTGAVAPDGGQYQEAGVGACGRNSTGLRLGMLHLQTDLAASRCGHVTHAQKPNAVLGIRLQLEKKGRGNMWKIR